MNIFLYIMIFIMGTVFGSFFTLAVYRIPLGKDITHERSFCPTCNHKLGFLDLIPVWSYIFLKGKCRYCGEKVRIRYLILEVLSGLVFLFAYLSLNVENIFFDFYKVIEFVFFVFFYVTLALVAGIDKEYRKIDFRVVIFGAVCQILYILYLYIIGETSMYRYGIYFAIFIFAFVVNAVIQKKKENYLLELITFQLYIFSVIGLRKSLIEIILLIVLMVILSFIMRKKYSEISKMSIGFLLSISTIVCEIVDNFMEFYII